MPATTGIAGSSPSSAGRLGGQPADDVAGADRLRDLRAPGCPPPSSTDGVRERLVRRRGSSPRGPSAGARGSPTSRGTSTSPPRPRARGARPRARPAARRAPSPASPVARGELRLLRGRPRVLPDDRRPRRASALVDRDERRAVAVERDREDVRPARAPTSVADGGRRARPTTPRDPARRGRSRRRSRSGSRPGRGRAAGRRA